MRIGFPANIKLPTGASLMGRSRARQTMAALFVSVAAMFVSASPSSAATWNNQTLTFTYQFPTVGSVFFGSPFTFVADGSDYLSTASNLAPATFSVTSVAPDELQIRYFYPLADYPKGVTLTSGVAFNGFTISGPSGLSPITAAFVDANSNVTGLTDSAISHLTNSVTVNLAGDVFSPGSVGLIDLRVAETPLPATLPLLASGLGALGVVAHRRKRKAAA
jgi:hypothetical protein